MFFPTSNAHQYPIISGIVYIYTEPRTMLEEWNGSAGVNLWVGSLAVRLVTTLSLMHHRSHCGDTNPTPSAPPERPTNPLPHYWL